MHNLLITWQRYEIVFICRVFAIHFLLIRGLIYYLTIYHLPFITFLHCFIFTLWGYGFAEIPTSHKHTQIASPQITDTPFTKMMRMAAMPEMNSETHPHFPSL